ncbi:lipid A biosynthesis lauroyl acyltransferase [Chlamydia abortus]|uniref:Lipid A biosynthesis-related protein n=1 Tax=Chlamydia abortus (strain DSM 27085 / S26/3) TaxID=218497 RepID=Q5L5K0_CHLAB|nr:lipid A biosynthesis lauroyl acyltransferase [Chlamydia abortus]ASD30768.1 lipid A biosynthesis lauroyl acyltransferase [Chlamydia abortus]AUS60121.1 lipid A biosynthesis lauroyl acyltransferase [Chlamydia abortus]QRR31408.1 lipid A biosynthesis lauroyl acyltransferase [Chlamydia abortus]CAH64091.1 putative lipid A biosynthesis-related protein [Chlamydia abortus S26/3]CED80696.1 putative lipid A biosynthesis-related protein [Chlamydia abortus]
MFNTLRRAKKSFVDCCVYYLGITLIGIFKRIPHSWLHRLGKALGTLVFYTISDYKKTALTNLALAFPDKSFKERQSIAKHSIQHVMITVLELLAVEGLIGHLNDLISIATAEARPRGFSSDEVLTQKELQDTFSKLNENKGVILFCGHQANWELPFLYITRDYPGLAFAKPIKNARLNKKIFSLREIFKGKIVAPKQGINSALHALQQGHVIGIVGDQALLISSYTYPLFGHEAFTTTSPALLAYKTGKPVIAVSICRNTNGYTIVPSKKLYADKSLPIKDATTSLMNKLMGFLEKGIAHQPQQWMWMHKRWKRKLSPGLKKKYAYSHILVIVNSRDLEYFEQFLSDLARLYSGAALTLALYNPTKEKIFATNLPQYTIQEFSYLETLYTLPNSFPAVFDLAELPVCLHKHFKKTGSVVLYTRKALEKNLSQPTAPLITALKKFSKNAELLKKFF